MPPRSLSPARAPAARCPIARAPAARGALLLAASLAALVSAAPGARAQQVDYGALEALFGEPVTLSATGKPQRASEVPANLVIVTREEIARSAATTIPEVLRRVAGVDVRQTSRDTFDVNVRGYNSGANPRLLVLLNGRQVYLDYYGTTNWSAIPVALEEIRQIEVVKGPAGALFGFNAASGVINIVTLDPITDKADTLAVKGGTQHYREGVGVVGASNGQVGVRLSATARNDDAARGGLLPRDLPLTRSPSRRTFLADARARIADGVTGGLEFSYATNWRNDVAPGGVYLNSDYETFSAKGNISAETGIGLVTATVYHNRMNADEISILLPTALNMRNDVTVAQLSDLVQLGEHTFRVGGEYRSNTMNTTPDKAAKVGYQVLSGSAMWSWNLSEAWSLTNAARVDALRLGRTGADVPGTFATVAAYDRERVETSFNSGLVWKASANDTLRLTAGRALQLPSLLEYGFLALPVVGPGGRPLTPYILGNPRIDPTTVEQVEVSWDRRIEAIGGSLRASVFALRQEDLKSQPGGIAGFVGRVPYLTFENVGRSRSIGTELSANGTFGSHPLLEGFRWSGAYGLQFVEDKVPGNAFAKVYSIDFEQATPVNTGRLGLGWAKGPWDVDLFAYAQSATRQLRTNVPGLPQDLVRVPAFLSVQAKVRYQVAEGLEAAVIGQQLNAASHRESSAAETERRVLVSFTWRP